MILPLTAPFGRREDGKPVIVRLTERFGRSPYANFFDEVTKTFKVSKHFTTSTHQNNSIRETMESGELER